MAVEALSAAHSSAKGFRSKTRGSIPAVALGAGARADAQHFETFGLQIYRKGQVVVHVWQGHVTGMLPVPYLGATDTLEVKFFDPDSVLYLPPVPNAWLKRLLSAPATAHYDSLGQWKFSLTGTQAVPFQRAMKPGSAVAPLAVKVPEA